MPPDFVHCKPRVLEDWSNYSGTIGPHKVSIYCEVPVSPDDGNMLRRHADAVREILRYCFAQDPPATVRTVGSKWSFSKVIEPGQVVVDPGNMYYIDGIPQEHWSALYRARAAQRGNTPVFVEGGTGIATLNQSLGENSQLALRTSGAGNGHRMGGCIATGTHGSALDVGALHDTVLAMYLIVAPDQAVFVQSGTNSPFEASIVPWLEQQTGIPTKHVADDKAIAAARVGLGSIGFVFGVVVETADLYQFQIRRVKRLAGDKEVREAIATLETAPLHPDTPERPYHFDVVMHPYPYDDEPCWFATMMWKRKPTMPFASPAQGIARTTTDTMGMIAGLANALGEGLVGAVTFAIVRSKILGQLKDGAKDANSTLFPGQVFGPTTLPAGSGASTEIAVDHQQALAAIDTVFEVLKREADDAGRFLLGCVAVRFVRKSRSLLGMNQFDMNCFIELPSIHNAAVLRIYREVWAALERKGIRFTCHWGQLNDFTPERVQRYFGENVSEWKKARRALLGNDDTAMHVFASAILKDTGLDG